MSFGRLCKEAGSIARMAKRDNAVAIRPVAVVTPELREKVGA
jgi:hypothetical protein